MSECNDRVMRYTQYIIDVTQYILVVLKDVVFNRRPVPYIRVRLGKQEPNVIQSLGQMCTKRSTARLNAIKCYINNNFCFGIRAKLWTKMSPNLLLIFSSQICVMYFT